MKKALYLLMLILAGITSSCKKDQSKGSTLDLIRDSVYYYAKEDYYWNTSLPTYDQFSPRGYTGSTDINALSNEVDALSQYAINPATNQPYEYYAPDPGEAKYSFIDDGSVSAQLNGVKGDFGFAPLYNTMTDLRVKYVYPGSPADLAGIKRGYQITTINGNSNFPYDCGTCTNTQFVINAYSNSSAITMTLKKPDGTSFNVSLNTASYTVNPVLNYQVYDEGNGHKVGYIVFNSFTADANADPQLNTAFNYFITNGVTDLVVDLRYNGGGYVSTSQYLDNLIVPPAKSNTLMYNTYYNSNLTSNNDPLFTKQFGPVNFSVAANAVNFTKVGSLNISRVFFIVTGATASASELTINNLIPELNVQLIGSTSYGKPVGFFAININKYQYYTPEFATMNSANQGGYYAGMTPGSSTYPGVQDFDDVTKDFGDPTEGLLAHALNYVKTGVYSVQSPQIQSVNGIALRSFSLAQFNAAANQLEGHKFRGMVLNNPAKHLK